jgi:hypothetical protein
LSAASALREWTSLNLSLPDQKRLAALAGETPAVPSNLVLAIVYYRLVGKSYGVG